MRNGKEKNLDNAVNIGSYEDDVLAGLICKWCDVQPGELKGAWQQKTYEASIGDIYYESRPTERSIVRITLLTTPPTNAETTPYYKMGDVIKL